METDPNPNAAKPKSRRRWYQYILRMLLVVAAMLAAVCGYIACAKHEPPHAAPAATPIVVLALNEHGAPQFDYEGPGALNYRYSLSSFTFEIGPVAGTPWISVKGEVDIGDRSSLVLSIHSSSDRAYEIQMLGISKSDSAAITADQAKETLNIPAGNHEIKIDRFVVFTYDFTKS